MRRADIDPGALRVLIEDEKLTQATVAQKLGVSLSCIERRCTALGLKTQRTGPRDGAGHPNWKGGTQILKGYRYVWASDHPYATRHHRVAEHRLVMEAMIGRYLHPEEVVHHRDGNPLNNDPANLALFPDNGSHLAFELTGRVPNWSEVGRAVLRQSVERSAKNRRLPTYDGPTRRLKSDHF